VNRPIENPKSKIENLAFALTDAQCVRLAVWRAWWEESEERYRHWEIRERDEETAEAIGRVMQEADFASGGDLTLEQLDRLCGLARSLAVNRNLDRRLYTGPGEPAEFNRLLRNLLFGPGLLPDRLAAFLTRKGVGVQTVSQLLCAAFPTQYPILTASALLALELTPEQKEAARRQAAALYRLDEARSRDLVPQILRDFVIYAAVRESLGTPTYLEAHRILQRAPQEAMETALAVGPPVVREESAPYAPTQITEEDLLAHLEAYIAGQGFVYPPLTIRNYYVALKTKPFVILCGISGTGKTQLTRLFAEALTGDLAAQYRLLPVRPDWTDSTALLGFWNVLAGPEGRYVSTRFLDFLREAGRPENAGRSYFVCLDEMNLARVEHYFADFLSAMESPDRTVPLHGDMAVRIPPNFFVTGSVNVDETTFTFSRKVLDRANTIEFGVVDFSVLGVRSEVSGQQTQHSIPDTQHLQSLFLGSRVLDVAAAQRKLNALEPAFVRRALETLTALNEALAVSQLPFGYRVRDEVLMYLANSFDARGRGLLDANPSRNGEIALDFQIVQKVLPRLSGTQEQIEAALRALADLLLPGSETLIHNAVENAAALERLAAQAAFPRSARKLIRLLVRLQRDGYASFYDG